jgi:hypothetical protein
MLDKGSPEKRVLKSFSDTDKYRMKSSNSKGNLGTEATILDKTAYGQGVES